MLEVRRDDLIAGSPEHAVQGRIHALGGAAHDGDFGDVGVKDAGDCLAKVPGLVLALAIERQVAAPNVQICGGLVYE